MIDIIRRIIYYAFIFPVVFIGFILIMPILLCCQSLGFIITGELLIEFHDIKEMFDDIFI